MTAEQTGSPILYSENENKRVFVSKIMVTSHNVAKPTENQSVNQRSTDLLRGQISSNTNVWSVAGE